MWNCRMYIQETNKGNHQAQNIFNDISFRLAHACVFCFFLPRAKQFTFIHLVGKWALCYLIRNVLRRSSLIGNRNTCPHILIITHCQREIERVFTLCVWALWVNWISSKNCISYLSMHTKSCAWVCILCIWNDEPSQRNTGYGVHDVSKSMIWVK